VRERLEKPQSIFGQAWKKIYFWVGGFKECEKMSSS
jgi:hypothetical protein